MSDAATNDEFERSPVETMASDDYETGYANGESSMEADISTLCDDLGIPVEDKHPLTALRDAILSQREMLANLPPGTETAGTRKGELRRLVLREDGGWNDVGGFATFDG